MVSFLLGGNKTFEVLDFPYYFSEITEIVYRDNEFLQDSFNVLSDLRLALEENGLEPILDDSLRNEESAIIIAEFISLDSSLSIPLSEDGISVSAEGNSISLVDIGEIDRSGGILFHLKSVRGGNHQLFILADNLPSLENGIALLINGGLDPCVLHPSTAFCGPETLVSPTLEETEEEPPTLQIEPTEAEGSIETPEDTPQNPPLLTATPFP